MIGFQLMLDWQCCVYLWLFNVYMDGVVREVNAGVPERGLELLLANCGRL